jgi:hypothetical protein
MHHGQNFTPLWQWPFVSFTNHLERILDAQEFQLIYPDRKMASLNKEHLDLKD